MDEKVGTRKKWHKSLTIVQMAEALNVAHQVFSTISHDLQVMLIKLHSTFDAVDATIICDEGKLAYGIRLLEGSHTHTITIGVDMTTKVWYLQTNEQIEYTTFGSGRRIDLGKNPDPIVIVKQLRSLPQFKSVREAGTMEALASKLREF